MSSMTAQDLPYDLDDLLEQADGYDELTEWETEFVADMRVKYRRHGLQTYVSEGQYAALERIREKVA